MGDDGGRSTADSEGASSRFPKRPTAQESSSYSPRFPRLPRYFVHPPLISCHVPPRVVVSLRCLGSCIWSPVGPTLTCHVVTDTLAVNSHYPDIITAWTGCTSIFDAPYLTLDNFDILKNSIFILFFCLF